MGTRAQLPRRAAPRLAAAFEDQLRFFAEHLVSVGPADLLELHAGRWPYSKPGLLLTFDDGLHHEPSHRPDERSAPSWSDLQRLDGVHEICCHGWSHRSLGPRLESEELDLEIDFAKRRLEEKLGHPVDRVPRPAGGAPAALREAGFPRRALPRTVGVCIDRHGVLPTRAWYMVPADGDMGH